MGLCVCLKKEFSWYCVSVLKILHWLGSTLFCYFSFIFKKLLECILAYWISIWPPLKVTLL